MRIRSLIFLAASAALPAAHAAETKPTNRVTVSAVCTDLGRLCKELSRQTGVHIRASADIADEKVDVFVQDEPIDLMRKQLATVFGYRWVTTPGKETAYRFYRDENMRVWQGELRRRAKVEDRARTTALMDALGNYLALSDADVDKLPSKEQQFARYVRSSGQRSGYSVLAGLTGDQRTQLLDSGLAQVDVNSSDISLREGLADQFGGWMRLRTGRSTSGSDLRSVQVIGNGLESRFPPDPDQLMVQVRTASRSWGMSLALSPSAFAHSTASAPDTNAAVEEMSRFTGGKPVHDSADPRLEKTVPVRIEPPAVVNKFGYQDPVENDWCAALRRVAEAARIPIISDHYTGMESNVYKPADSPYAVGGWKARPALTRLLEALHHEWTWQDGALLIRTRSWPKKMVKEIPLRVIDAMSAAGPKPDRPRRTNLAQALIASRLTDEQLDQPSLLPWSADWAYLPEQRVLVRFVASLNPLQVNRMKSTSGLDLTSLTGKPADALAEFYRIRWTRQGYAPRVISVRVSQKPFDFGPVVFDASTPKPSAEDIDVWVTYTFRIVLPNEVKDSSVMLLLGPDGPEARAL